MKWYYDRPHQLIERLPEVVELWYSFCDQISGRDDMLTLLRYLAAAGKHVTLQEIIDVVGTTIPLGGALMGTIAEELIEQGADYRVLIDILTAHFGERLKLLVLFGSRSRGEARSDSDHDILLVVDDLPQDPLARRRDVMMPLLPMLLHMPERLALIAKTPQEIAGDLTPLLVDVCVDGIALYGMDYFSGLRDKVVQVLHAAGLQRRRVGGTWMWIFPALPVKEWALTWDGYHEHSEIC